MPEERFEELVIERDLGTGSERQGVLVLTGQAGNVVYIWLDDTSSPARLMMRYNTDPGTDDFNGTVVASF